MRRSQFSKREAQETVHSLDSYYALAVITRPPDGVLLAPSALAARRLRRLASLLEL